MDFPLQVTQSIIIRDSNGNLIIKIGPQPVIDVMAPPPSQAKIEIAIEGTTESTLSFWDPDGRRYSIFGDSTPPPTLTMQQDTLIASGCAVHIINSDNASGIGAIFLQAKTNDNSGAILDGVDNYLHKGRFDIGGNTYQVEQFTNLALLAGWTNFGGGYPPLRFLKLPDGMLQIEGTIRPGTTVDGTTVAVLPVGYRPSTYIRRMPIMEKGFAMMADVLPTGEIQVIGTTGVVTASFDGQICLL